MGLQEITLTRFRCFDQVTITPDPDAVTVLLSPNGTGKTSVLEAVHLLSTGQSFRTSAAGDLLQTDSDTAEVHGVVFSGVRRFQIDLVVRRGSRSTTKHLMVNGNRPSSRTELAESLPLTVFTPEGVDVIRQGPDQRRQLLDTFAVDVNPQDAPPFERYSRVLTQRNSLLRSFHGDYPLPARRRELEVWDSEFVHLAHQVRRIREAFLDELEPRLADTYSSLAGRTTPVSLEYLPSSTQPLDRALHDVLRDDIQRGYSTIGPHRDDFRVLLEHRDARRQASQGEQRSLALALRLAAHELVSKSGRSPLILLDDVFSELDPSRASRLIDLLPVGQTLVTTATPLTDAFADAFIVDVRKNS